MVSEILTNLDLINVPKLLQFFKNLFVEFVKLKKEVWLQEKGEWWWRERVHLLEFLLHQVDLDHHPS
jgi:hypothetical protein